MTNADDGDERRTLNIQHRMSNDKTTGELVTARLREYSRADKTRSIHEPKSNQDPGGGARGLALPVVRI